MKYKLTGKTVLFEKEPLAEVVGPTGERLFVSSQNNEAILEKLNLLAHADQIVGYQEEADLLDEKEGFMLDLQNEREALDEKEKLFLEDWNKRFQAFKSKR